MEGGVRFGARRVPSCINVFESIPRARVGTHVKKKVFVIGLFVLLKTRMGQMEGQGEWSGFQFGSRKI